VQRLSPAVAAVVALAGALAPAVALADEGEQNTESVYLARDFIFVDSPAIEGYLRAICKRLLDAKGLKREVPHILVQSSDAFNAFADAQGNLVVSTGALRAMESEDELAALLAHELSHLVLQHPVDKGAMQSLPLGMETMSAMRDASAELKGQKVSQSGDLSHFDLENVSNTQATNLLWSDLISPSWNRKQEREADENGFELMRAAGYDPSAFGQLFSKLQAAEVKRTERMQVLKKALVVRLKEAGTSARVGSGGRAETVAITREVQGSVSEGASEKLVDGLSTFNRSYDSPDERQSALAAYAREHRQQPRAPRPEMRFKEVLQEGEGGHLLQLDAAAVLTLGAIAAKKGEAAKILVQGLGSEDTTQPSAHLNLALGSWHQAYGRAEVGERLARAWLESGRPPAQAFRWVASYEARDRDFASAIDTLEAGRKRVGASAPFLPNLVAMARASGNMSLARDYARQCESESRSSVGDKVQSFLTEDSKPKGLYAECVRQLGEAPEKDVIAEGVKDKTRDLGRKLLNRN
jgi:Zn-dependent protease with chaperone function